MALPRPVKAVVFDMDGLLVATEQVVFDAMQQAASGAGREMPFELFKRMIGLPGHASDAIVVEHFGKGFDLEVWRREVSRHFDDIAAAGIALKTGVLELLDALDAHGLPRAVATSSTRHAVEHSLGQHGLIERFHAIISRELQTRHKPHPDPFLIAAQALGVAPEDCLALEDSHNGVRSASAAGMMTIMVPDMLDPTEEMQSLCVRIAADLHEVRELVERQRL
ncbi:HAD family hydrolase [Phenylobacterium soli]|uniref:HAD family phosphatase n=1 Tax=Phenylobacterium soli TaxID=2170551 RepID=A0A328AJE6_9CAUL|nr:HAD family phosphatase [Phenylobacterium soli]RAK54621.1 HAD family phosphatase [Phenylobacterium soli]